MSEDVNVFEVSGRLTRDPELRYTTNGTAILNGSIASNKSVKINGEWTEKAGFFDFKMFGKRAESLSKYMVKGKKFLLHGSMDYESWEKDGQKRSKLIMAVDKVFFMDGKDSGSNQKNNTISQNTHPVSNSANFEDDIPF